MFWTWKCSPSVVTFCFWLVYLKSKKKKIFPKQVWLLAHNICKASYKFSIYYMYQIHYRYMFSWSIHCYVYKTITYFFSSIQWYLNTKSDSSGKLFTTDHFSNFFYIYMLSQLKLHIDNFKNAGIMRIICILCVFHI